MDHILSYCNAPGQKRVWELTKALFAKKSPKDWPHPGKGAILTCALAKFDSAKEGKVDVGLGRLYQIIVSTSAQFIWAMRCERTIKNENRTHSIREVENRWLAKINERLHLDCKLTDEKKFGKKAIGAELVRDTWTGTIEDEDSLPIEWERTGGVLVGMGQELRRAPGEGDGTDDDDDDVG
jgi:hypothetical protein